MPLMFVLLILHHPDSSSENDEAWLSHTNSLFYYSRDFCAMAVVGLRKISSSLPTRGNLTMLVHSGHIFSKISLSKRKLALSFCSVSSQSCDSVGLLASCWKFANLCKYFYWTLFVHYHLPFHWCRNVKVVTQILFFATNFLLLLCCLEASSLKSELENLLEPLCLHENLCPSPLFICFHNCAPRLLSQSKSY